jgi:hypothetical protein
MILIFFFILNSQMTNLHSFDYDDYYHLENQTYGNFQARPECAGYVLPCIPFFRLLCVFSNFTELKFECSKFESEYFVFYPRTKQIIDKDLKIKLSRENVVDYYWGRNIILKFAHNFEGIDLNSRLLEYIQKDEISKIDVIFSDIKFYIYFNRHRITRCADINDIENLNVSPLRTNNPTQLEFGHLAKYSTNICPILFKDASLISLIFYGFSDNIVKKNYISFDDQFYAHNDTVNSAIKSLYLYYLYRFNIDASLLNKYVFEKLEKIHLMGLFTIDSENIDLFLSLKYLKTIELSVNHIREYLNGNWNWMRFLKFHKNKVKVYLKDRPRFKKREYEFPDEDFCLFYQKLKSMNQKFQVKYDYITKCSCLLKYLIEEGLLITQSKTECQDIFCNFTERFRNCKTLFINNLKNIDSYDLKYYVESVDYVTSVIMSPVFYTLALIFNALCHLILRRIESRRDRNHRLYYFMQAHSIVNYLYSGLNYFNLLTICIEYNGVYCSPFFRSQNMQYFKIYFMTFLNGVLRTLSILTFLLVSFERLVLLKNDSKSCLSKLVRTSLKKLNILCILTALLLNFPTVFHYELNKLNNYSTGSYPSSLLYEYLKRTDPKIMYISVVSFFINDVILFLMTLCIDLLLVRQLINDMKEKKSLPCLKVKTDNMRNAKMLLFKKKVVKSTKIILLNLVILSAFRLIDLLVPIYRLAFLLNTNLESFIGDKVSVEFEQIVHFFFILPITYTIVFYTFINVKFKEQLLIFFRCA